MRKLTLAVAVFVTICCYLLLSVAICCYLVVSAAICCEIQHFGEYQYELQHYAISAAISQHCCYLLSAAVCSSLLADPGRIYRFCQILVNLKILPDPR